MASHHADKGLKSEREVIAKSGELVKVEIVEITDRAKAKKSAKGKFEKGKFLGTWEGDFSGRQGEVVKDARRVG